MMEESHCLFCSSLQMLISSKQFFSFMDVQLYLPAWYKMRKASGTVEVNSTGTLFPATTKYKVLFPDNYWNEIT